MLEAADYVTTCTENSECIIILVGDYCDATCDEAAINVADIDAYRSDRDAIDCPDGPPSVMICEGGSIPVCIEGRCAVY